MPFKRRLSKARQYRISPAAAARWREVGPEAIPGRHYIADDELAELLGMHPLLARAPDDAAALIAALDNAAGGRSAG